MRQKGQRIQHEWAVSSGLILLKTVPVHGACRLSFKNFIFPCKLFRMMYDNYIRDNGSSINTNRKEVGIMDVKVTRNYSVYQNAVNSGKHTERTVSVPASGDKKIRGDAICISSDGVKKKEASSFAAALNKSMEEGASAEKIAALRQQVREGTYQVSAEEIAKRLMSGL